MTSRRAKIVCTLGPATSSLEQIKALMVAGMDVARLNLSHGAGEDHRETFRLIRQASAEVGKDVGILIDLQGPKIRLGHFAEGPVQLAPGDTFTITTDDILGGHDIVSTTHKNLTQDVAPGDTVLLDDGRLVLRVEDVKGPEVRTTVVVGGPISNSKGLNLPGVAVSVPSMSDKDIADLRLALSLPADMIAMSFVRGPEDIEVVHKIMEEEGVRLPVMAKLEKPQMVERLEEVVNAFDAIMVARGDLGVELPLEQVPMVQKRAIELCRRYAKPVIVATQMLESMISSPRPTRSEVSDVANAILDGADAVMTSGETSVGRYPAETVATMARICEAVEHEALDQLPAMPGPSRTVGGAIARAAVITGAALEVKALCAFTQTGDTVRRLARHRNRIPLIAVTPDENIRHHLAFTWGVESYVIPPVHHTDEMVRQLDARLLDEGRLKEGDRVIIVAGSPPGTPGGTNAMRVHRIGVSRQARS